MSTAETLHRRGATAALQRPAPAATTNEASWLFTCVALLGIAALSSAAASSLLPGFSEAVDGGSSAGGLGAPLLGVAGVFSAAYGLGALAYGLLALRHGKLIRARILLPVLGIAAGVHLIVLLLGLWRMPVAERTFDITLASMLVLELTATAVLGWARNAPLRRPARQTYSAAGTFATAAKPRSAAAVVVTLFATSLFVAALTTVGMAASTAGELAVPHSGHGGSVHDSHGDHDSNVVPENLQRLKDQGHHH